MHPVETVVDSGSFVPRLDAVFPAHVGWQCLPGLGATTATRSAASQRRRQEFIRGRQAAYAALCSVGYVHAFHEDSESTPSAVIPRNADRSPRWPSGFVGSISHSRHWIFAAAARECDLASIGVDTEPIASPVQAESLQWEIGRVAEWKLLESLGLSITQAFTLLFSAKEAFYKSCYPLTKCFLDFQDVVACQVSTLPSESVDCTATGSIAMASRGAAGSELMVRYCLTDQDVFTIATASHGTVSQLP